MDRIDAVVVGARFGEAVHAPGLRLLEPLGVGDVTTVTREWRTAIEQPGVALVTVATPPASHREIAAAALAAGHAVLCEKPLAATVEDAEAMVEAAARAHRPAAVNFSYRAVPAFRRASELVHGGAVGEVDAIDVRWDATMRRGRAHSPGWKDSAAAGGGALAGYGVHALDYVGWLAGAASVESASFEPDVESDDACLVRLRLARGAEVRLAVSLVAEAPLHRVDIVGTEGTLVLESRSATDPVGAFALTLDGEPVETPPPSFAAPSGADPRIAPFASHAAALVRALRSGSPASPSFEDGLRAQRLVAAARRATS